MKTKTIVVPDIINEAKVAGCENADQIAGYLAVEVSRLRPMESALASARDELKRQREIWTGSKNDSWAIAAIDTEVGRIEQALGANK